MKNQKSKKFESLVVMLFFIALFIIIGLQFLPEVKDPNKLELSGEWKFSIGDNTNWAQPGWDDSNWKSVDVPGPWESEGFAQYNGFAWYRKEFELKEYDPEKGVFLKLGYIDDVDEVYVNGKLIGYRGGFPPQYKTAHNRMRKYYIPEEVIDLKKKNVIAVRVFDQERDGGILGEYVCLSFEKKPPKLALDMSGEWKFQKGDNMEWSSSSYNDTDWNNLRVPGYWEAQGHKNYDGFAWLRKEVNISRALSNQKLVLMLGKIDDTDQLYINGQLVGDTGLMWQRGDTRISDNEWQELRGYYIPDGLLKPDQPNLFAIRIYDAKVDGGIHEGPVGLITQKDYISYWKSIRNNRNK